MNNLDRVITRLVRDFPAHSLREIRDAVHLATGEKIGLERVRVARKALKLKPRPRGRPKPVANRPIQPPVLPLAQALAAVETFCDLARDATGRARPASAKGGGERDRRIEIIPVPCACLPANFGGRWGLRGCDAVVILREGAPPKLRFLRRPSLRYGWLWNRGVRSSKRRLTRGELYLFRLRSLARLGVLKQQWAINFRFARRHYVNRWTVPEKLRWNLRGRIVERRLDAGYRRYKQASPDQKTAPGKRRFIPVELKPEVRRQVAVHAQFARALRQWLRPQLQEVAARLGPGKKPAHATRQLARQVAPHWREVLAAKRP